MTVPIKNKLHIHYPCSDGKRMADNTRQWNWISRIKNGLEVTTAGENIFVAGDLLWYFVEGNNKLRVAPDVMVAIGRPKGDRNSYLQWEEEHITPQIVFEILSPSNSKKEMFRKHRLYENLGVEEYYVYDPDHNKLLVYNRIKDELVVVQNVRDWTSPLLQIRFIWTNETLEIYHPNGEPFLSHVEFSEVVKAAKLKAAKAEKERIKAEKERIKAEKERIKAEKERIKAEKAKAEAEEKTALMAAKLKELGIDPNSL